jgi:hypothetical protein
MQDKPTQDIEERWMKLCRQIVLEQDSDELTKLLKELNEVLQAREKQPREQRPQTQAQEKAPNQ